MDYDPDWRPEEYAWSAVRLVISVWVRSRNENVMCPLTTLSSRGACSSPFTTERRVILGGTLDSRTNQ